MRTPYCFPPISRQSIGANTVRSAFRQSPRGRWVRTPIYFMSTAFRNTRRPVRRLWERNKYAVIAHRGFEPKTDRPPTPKTVKTTPKEPLKRQNRPVSYDSWRKAKVLCAIGDRRLTPCLTTPLHQKQYKNAKKSPSRAQKDRSPVIALLLLRSARSISIWEGWLVAAKSTTSAPLLPLPKTTEKSVDG